MKTETKWTPKPWHKMRISYPVAAVPREDSVKECSIVDAEGIWIGDCDVSHAERIVSAINGRDELWGGRDELWGVLNSIRVARKMAGRGGNPYVFFEDIGKLMPRIEEVLAKAQGGTDGQT